MKRFSLVLISSIFVLFIASCGGESKDAKTENQAEEVTTTTEEVAVAETTEFDLDASVKLGEAIYSGKGLCHTCHQANGQGIEGTFPPLASADFLLADKDRAIKTTIYGNKEPITVNGTEYPGGMMTPATGLTDEEIRDVVNYILNSWGNQGGSVTTAEVSEQR